MSSGITINTANGVPDDGLNRSTADANDTAIDNFNPSSTENQLETQQIAAQLFGQVANTAAHIAIQNEANGNEDSPFAIALHGLIGVAQAAIAGGGNANAIVAGGTGAIAGTALTQYLENNGIDPNSTEGQLLLTAASSAIGAGVGALTSGGNISVDAQSGASAAAYSTLFNNLNSKASAFVFSCVLCILQVTANVSGSDAPGPEPMKIEAPSEGLGTPPSQGSGSDGDGDE